MKKIGFLQLFLFVLLSVQAWCQDNQKVQVSKQNSDISYEALSKSTARTEKGFVTLYKLNDKFYLEIPDMILGRQLLVTHRIISALMGSGYQADDIIGSPKYFTFVKSGNQLNLLSASNNIKIPDSTSSMFQAVQSVRGPNIIANYKIVLRTPDNTASVIDVSELIMSAEPLGSATATSIIHYDVSQNTLGIVANRNVSAPAASQAGGGGAPTTNTGGKMNVKTSIILLSAKPITSRLFDERVGYQNFSYSDFDNYNEGGRKKFLIYKWALSPAEKDWKNYLAGKLVEPENPIVFYIDPLTPPQWVPYMIKGIESWNTTFEQAGFKNAIIAKKCPINDTTALLQSAPGVIMYSLTIANDRPQQLIIDPRSGQIIQCHISFSHNSIAQLQQYYRLLVGVLDKDLKDGAFSDDLTGRLIQMDVTRKTGIALGLQYNMIASSASPVDSLRNKDWLKKNGTCPSILDINGVNYVAQPEDNIGRDGLLPNIGDYDKWAIEWGYRLFDKQSNTTSDQTFLNGLCKKHISNRRLWWLSGESNTQVQNPWYQSGDMGEDLVKANTLGIANLKNAMGHLREWSTAPHQEYSVLSNLYDGILNTKNLPGSDDGIFDKFIIQVAKLIGGVTETPWMNSNDGSEELTPVSKKQQLAALQFINEQLFEEPKWLINKEVYNRTLDNPFISLQQLQKKALKALVESSAVSLYNQELIYEQPQYRAVDMLQDLQQLVWKELPQLQPISFYRKMLQNNYIDVLMDNYKTSSYNSLLIASCLSKLKVDVKTAINNTRDKDLQEYLTGISYKLNSVNR